MTYDEIENAFFFVSGAPPFENSAVVHRVSGEIFYSSAMAGIDEIPEDAEEDDYLWIPHKIDLDLGKSLVMDFVRARCEDEIETVLAIFQHKGAYGRFKDLLAHKGLLVCLRTGSHQGSAAGVVRRERRCAGGMTEVVLRTDLRRRRDDLPSPRENADASHLADIFAGFRLRFCGMVETPQ
jgi:hypothetical protein